MLEQDELRIKVIPHLVLTKKQRRVYVQVITRTVTGQNEFFEKEGGSYVLGRSNDWFLHWVPAECEFVLSHRYGIENDLAKLCRYPAILNNLGLEHYNRDYSKEVYECILALLNPKPEPPKTTPQS